MNSNTEFDEFLELIEISKEIYAKTKETNDKFQNLKDANPHLNGLIPIRMDTNRQILDSALANLVRVIDLENMIRDLNAQKKKGRVDFEIGDVIVSKYDFSKRGFSYYTEDNNVYAYKTGSPFIVIDKKGSNFVIVPFDDRNSTRNQILIVDREKICLTFSKSNQQEVNQNWIKVEFTLNGIKEMYIRDFLTQIRLYNEDIRGKYGKYWDFMRGQTHSTRNFLLQEDEVFGTICTAYFKDAKKYSNYRDILFEFNDKFVVDFKQSKQQKDMYKYNSKSSAFSKDEGKYGTHYFPKDVFKGNIKERVVGLINIQQIIEVEERVENNV